MGLRTVPVTFAQARAFVADWHRHHRPPVGHKFSIGAANADNLLVGVAIIGRPVARHLDDGLTLEVTRMCSDGSRNCCSLLYAAAWQASKALGYRRLVTYTQAGGEDGASLRAAGWRIVAARPPRPGWHTPSRPRTDHGLDHTARLRWQPADTAPGAGARPAGTARSTSVHAAGSRRADPHHV